MQKATARFSFDAVVIGIAFAVEGFASVNVDGAYHYSYLDGPQYPEVTPTAIDSARVNYETRHGEFSYTLDEFRAKNPAIWDRLETWFLEEPDRLQNLEMLEMEDQAADYEY